MRKAIITIAIIIVAALYIGGTDMAWDIIHTLAYSFYSIFVSIIPFLDLEQAILCKIVTIVIVQVLFLAGIWISDKTEITIGKIVSGIVDAIATLLLIIA